MNGRILCFPESSTGPSLVIELDAAIDRRMRAFLDGRSDGEAVLDGLYGETLREPIPARLAMVVRG